MLDIADMKFHTGHKVRIYPSYKQKRIIAKSDGVQRFVYNRLVAFNNERYILKKTKAYVEPIARRLDYIQTILSSKKELSNIVPFLNDDEVDSLAIDNAYASYRAAWNNFKKNPASGIPTFHKKTYKKSYGTNPHYKKDAKYVSDCNVRLTDGNHILLPKLGRIRFSGSDRFVELMTRTSETRIGRITISMDSVGRYYASFQFGSMEPFHEVLPKTGRDVGYDLGIKRLYTDSDGNIELEPTYYKKAKTRLAKEQRKMSCRARVAQKAGKQLYEAKNYQKQRVKVALIHSHVANQRDDFHNVLTKREVKNHDRLFVEDVRSKDFLTEYKNMGSYGHNFARALSDRSWGIFTRQLMYKAAEYGKECIKIPAKDSTNTCSCCGYVLPPEKRLTIHQRDWVCPKCNTKHDRDENAANVILQRGVSPSQARQPAC